MVCRNEEDRGDKEGGRVRWWVTMIEAPIKLTCL